MSHPNAGIPAEQRFWVKVEKGGPVHPTLGTPCWLWTAALNPKGYGQFGQGRAHRFAYEMMIGPVPEGLQLDHLCRVRHCVNPAHLEPVTRKENILRGVCPCAINARKTHCDNGHELSDDNLMNLRNGYRRCRMCNTLSKRRQYARHLARKAAS